jgi:hypothetical protein
MAQDSFGRDAGNIDVRSMMQSLSGQVSQILETKDTNAEAALARVVDAVKEVASRIDSNYQQEEQSAAQWFKSVINSFKSTHKSQSKDSKSQYKNESLDVKLIRKAVQEIRNMGASPHTFWVGVGHFGNQGLKQLKQVLTECGICDCKDPEVETDAKKTKIDSEKASEKLKHDSDSSDMEGPSNSGFGGILNKLGSFSLIAAGILSKLGDMFETNLTDAFKGVLIHSNKFREDLRATMFQTQGFTETFRGMEKDFMDVYSATKAAGVSAAIFDNKWIKNLQTGFAYMSKAEKGDKSKDQLLKQQVKIHKSVQTSALNTAAALGMSVDGTNDMFMNWHMQLGMSANELANMGRSMRQISLSTGVTGENLERAMKSADSIMKDMRDTGSLTDTAAENVMNMTAISQKLGVEGTMSPLLKAMSGGTAMFDADAKTKKLLNSMMTGNGAAGRPNEAYWAIRSGGIHDDREMMGQAQDNMGARARKALRASGVDNADTLDLSNITKAMENMSNKQKAVLQTNFQNMVGALPGEFERINQTFEEGKKTEGQKLEEVVKEINSAKARGAGNTDATKALERKQNEMETGNIQQVFGKISDQMKEGKTFEQARTDVQKQIGGKFGDKYAAELLGNMGKSATTLMDSLSNRGKLAGVDVNKILSERGMSEKEIRNALTSGSSEQRQNATEILDGAMQEIAQTEKSNADPITKINDAIRVTNDYLQRIADGVLFGSDSLVQILFWTTKIGSLVGLIFGLMQYAPKLFNFLSSLNPFSSESSDVPLIRESVESIRDMGANPHTFWVGIGHFGNQSMNQLKQICNSTSNNDKSTIGKGTNRKNTIGKRTNGKNTIGKRNGKSTIGKSTIGKDISNAISPFTKGFKRAKSSGAGFIGSIRRGVSGQMMSSETGRSAIDAGKSAIDSARSVIDAGKSAIDSARSAMTFENIKKTGKSVIGDIKGVISPFTKGFARARASGTGVVGSIRRGVSGQMMSSSTVRSGMNMISPFTKGFGGARAAGTGLVGSIGSGASGQMMSSAAGRSIMSAAPMIGNVMTRALGPLILALGGVKGAMEAETVGRTKLEGGILGALTGGAGTGSMFSGMLGIDKGSTADKSLGVVGGAAWGAAAGAAIGVWFGGVGAGPGALIGAAVGAIVEVIKILTEGTTTLVNIFSPIQGIIDIIYNVVKNIGGILYGIVTFDLKKVFTSAFKLVGNLIRDIVKLLISPLKMLYGIGQLLWNTISSLGGVLLSALKSVFIEFPIWLGGALLSGLKSVFVDFPKWLGKLVYSALESVFVDFPRWLGGLLISGLKSVFIDFPKWVGKQFVSAFNFVSNIGTWIKDGLASLADNEWVGPIFATLSEAFNAIYDGWMAVYTPLKNGFNEIYQIIKSIIDPITSLFSGVGNSTSEWSLLGVVMSGLQITVNVLAQAVAFLLRPVVIFAKVLGFVLKVIGKVVTAIMKFAIGIAEIIKGIFTLDGGAIYDGLVTAFYSAPKVIYDMFVAGISMAWNGIKSFFTTFPSWLGGLLLNGLKSVFIDFPMWLGGKIVDLGVWIYDNTIGALLGMIPDWIKNLVGGAASALSDPIGFVSDTASTVYDAGAALYECVTSGLSGLGGWIYDNTIGAMLNMIPDWIKNLVSGAGDIISDPVGAVKNAASAVYDTGANVVNTAIDVVSDPIGSAKAVGGMAYDAGAAVLDWANPFNYFEEGTKNVKQPGLAVLHAGEMVIPKDEVKTMTAVGNGPFGSSEEITGSLGQSNIGSMFSGAKDIIDPLNISGGIGSMFSGAKDIIDPLNITGGIGSMFSGAKDFMLDPIGSLFGTSNKTEKEKDAKPEDLISNLINVGERLIEALNYVILESEESSSSGGMGLGLFDPVNVLDAMGSGVSTMTSTTMNPVGSVMESLTNAFTNKSNIEKSENKGVADSGNSMYYSDIMGSIMQPLGGVVESLMQTPIGQTVKQMFGKGQTSTNLMDYSDSTKGQTSVTGNSLDSYGDNAKGQVSTNLMDYSDSTKGTVSTSMFGMMDSESRVAQEKYGSMPSGYSIPGMSGIEGYLAEEQSMMRTMIDYLSKIENNTKSISPTGSNLIQPSKKGLPLDQGLKMRRISQEQSSGEWDLAFGDYSPASAT